MKVLHLINTLSAGGAELHLLTLCRHMKRQGVEIVVAYLREQVKGSQSLRPDFEREKIRTIDLQANSPYDWRFLRKLIRLLKNEQPMILHTHLPRADWAGAIGHWYCPSIRWVCSVHDIYERSWSGKWSLPLFTWIWSRADALIAISSAVRDWLVEKKCIASAKVVTIHYGIEFDKYARLVNDSCIIRQREEKPIIGSIGRLESRKGHDTLIRAMPTVFQQRPTASLLIAGHDPWGYGRVLQELIDELGLTRQVHLVGFQHDVPSFLQTLEVFAFATRSEGFGQVLIEAMAAGKPVVASKISPLTEIVADGGTGLLVEPDNPKAFAHAILWLFAHPEEARQMGRQGQELVAQQFSAERMTEQTLSLYREFIDMQR